MNAIKERRQKSQPVNMRVFGNLSFGFFRIIQPFFEGGPKSGSIGGGGKNRRHSENMTNFTGFYKNVYYVNGVPQYPKEKRKLKNLPVRGTLTSENMNKRED